MEGELNKFERLYAELGDEHLLDLADDAGDLTDEARFALERELVHRGLASKPAPHTTIAATVEAERETGFGPGIPGMFPGGASAMEQALEPVERRKDGLTTLISFYDGIELSKACDLLEAANISPVIQPVAGDALIGVPPRFELWLDQADIAPAKTLLREKMGLFPAAEVDEDGEGDVAATGLVGVFDTQPEAQHAHTLLADAGIHATTQQDDETGEWIVTVAPAQQDRAVSLVAGELGLG